MNAFWNIFFTPDSGVYTPPSGTLPIITLIGGIETVVQNSVYNSLGATATDDLDGDITSSIVKTDNLDLSTIGVYQEFYNVTNSSGQAAVQVVRTINVVDEGVNAFPYIFPFELN